MQPLRTKKITQPIGTKKNHATSWDKKITQPLGQKNSSTSQDKNMTLKIAPNGINFVQMGPNRSKWIQIVPNFSKRD